MLATRLRLVRWNWPPGLSRDSVPALSYSHIVFIRTLLDVGGSFRAFSQWARSAQLVGCSDFKDKAALTLERLQSKLGPAGMQRMEEQLRFWCTDNAHDETRVGALLRDGCLRQMSFHCRDMAHSSTVLKNAMAGDPEVDLVTELLVTGKKPQVWQSF